MKPCSQFGLQFVGLAIKNSSGSPLINSHFRSPEPNRFLQKKMDNFIAWFELGLKFKIPPTGVAGHRIWVRFAKTGSSLIVIADINKDRRKILFAVEAAWPSDNKANGPIRTEFGLTPDRPYNG